MGFQEWFIRKMNDIGYDTVNENNGEISQWIDFSNGSGDGFEVHYLTHSISPEIIRIIFSHTQRPVLFVVDTNLVDFRTMKEKWLRALHAIYYGRVYIWTGNRIDAAHFDFLTDTIPCRTVDIDSILFTDTDCKLKDFPGIFHIARFYDKAFWTEKVNSKQSAKDRKWDDFEKRQQRKTDEDIYEAFKRAFREHMRNHNAYHDYEPVQPRYAPKGDKWLDLFIGTGSIEAARVKYRELAKQFHPDLNPGSSEALSTMQAINIAFDKVKEYWK